MGLYRLYQEKPASMNTIMTAIMAGDGWLHDDGRLCCSTIANESDVKKPQ
jgi:hypothetical protein